MTELPSKQLESFIKFAEDCQENYSIAYSCVGMSRRKGTGKSSSMSFASCWAGRGKRSSIWKGRGNITDRCPIKIKEKKGLIEKNGK